MRLWKLFLTSSALILSAGTLCCPKLFAQTSPSPPDQQTLRVYSREVVVDVNVTDSRDNPVHGLTRANFTILEDGKQISPRSFREHRSDQQPADSPAPAKPSLPPNTFSNNGPAESVRPLDILLLDALDTPIATQSILQKRMVDFVDKMVPGTRVAIFSLSATGQLSMLQGFTSDTDLLKKALKSKKLSLQIPTLEDTGQDQNADTGQAPNMDVIQNDKPRQRVTKPAAAPQPTVDQNVECNHAAARGQYTIAALTQIARYLSGMPGRKNLVWYTGTFPMRMRDKQGGVCYDVTDDLGAADGLLSHSHVVLYPVDPRAIDALAKDGPMSAIVRRQSIEHLTMEAIAEQTGGKAFYTTNDLASTAVQAFDAGSNYYTITYTPTNQTNDTRLRTISVKVDQPGLNLIYPHGYHALPPNTTLSGKPIEKATPIQSAMMRGSLQPTEILFHVGVAAAPTTEASLPPGNKADPKAMKPPYRHLTLSYLVDINGIQFDESSDGNYHGQFEFAVNVYDPGDGKVINSNDMAARPTLPPAAYQSMLNSGARLRQEIDLPATGEYILRVGVHDLTTDHVGAIEIPVSAIHP